MLSGRRMIATFSLHERRGKSRQQAPKILTFCLSAFADRRKERIDGGTSKGWSFILRTVMTSALA